MEYKKGDICYIIENGRNVKPARIMARQGDFYVIQLVGSCGAIRLKKHRIYSTKEEAESSVYGDKKCIDAQVDVDNNNTGFVDVFEGKRFAKNPYI